MNRNYNVLFSIVITFLITYHIVTKKYSRCLRSPSTLVLQTLDENLKTFRASEDELLNLHKIPKMLHPTKRIQYLTPFEYQIQKDERLLFYRLMEIFDRITKENGIGYFIHGGTLLGSYRNHDIIPWDDDLDVFVNIDDRNLLASVLRRSNLPELVLFHTTSHDKLYFNNESVTSNPYGWKWPYIDIGFFKQNETHIYNIVEIYGKVDTYPNSIIFPLSTRPFFTLDLSTPKDAFAYLVWSFGYSNMCSTNPYSHMIEDVRGEQTQVNCSVLSNRFPWVNRSRIGNQIVEELIFKKKIIQRTVINEPLYAVSQTYALKLKEEFPYPDDVMLPYRDIKT